MQEVEEYINTAYKYLGLIADQNRFCYAGEGKEPLKLNKKNNALAITQARVNKADDFQSLQEIISNYEIAHKIRPIKGIGIWLGTVDNITLCGIDIDQCIDDAGKLSEEARKAVELVKTYTELSISGKGLHMLLMCKGQVKEPYVNKKKFEMYYNSIGRYFTLSLNHLEGTPTQIREVTEEEIHELGEQLKEVFKLDEKGQKLVYEPIKICSSLSKEHMDVFAQKVLPLLDEMKKNYPKLGKLLDGDISDYPSHSEADAGLTHYLMMACRDAGLDQDEAGAFCLNYYRFLPLYRPKWDKKHSSSGETYGELTVKKALAHIFEVMTVEEAIITDFWRLYDFWMHPLSGNMIIELRETGEIKGEITQGKGLHGISVLNDIINTLIMKNQYVKQVIIDTKGKVRPKVQQIKDNLIANLAKDYEPFFRYTRGRITGCGYLIIDANHIVKLDAKTGSWRIIKKSEIQGDNDLIQDSLKPYLANPKRTLYYPTMEPLSKEKKKEVIQRLRKIMVNLDDINFNLFLLYLFSTLRCYDPKPILYLSGTAGSGKTFIAQDILQEIFDRDTGLSLGISSRGTERDLIGSINSYIVVFDNKSKEFSEEISNILCTMSTARFGRILIRRLFHSSPQECYLNCMIILTGIDLKINRKDLAQRIWRINTELAPELRKSTVELRNEIKELVPELLAIVLDSAAKSIKYEAHPEADSHHEFIRQVVEAAKQDVRHIEALGFSIRGLLEIFDEEEIKQMVDEMIIEKQEVMEEAAIFDTSAPFTEVMVAFLNTLKMQGKDEFRVSASRFYELFRDNLEVIIPHIKPSLQGRTTEEIIEILDLPRNAISMGIALRDFKSNTNLARKYQITKYRTNSERGYVIKIL